MLTAPLTYTLHDLCHTAYCFNVGLIPTTDGELLHLWRRHHPQRFLLEQPLPPEGGSILAVGWRASDSGALTVAFSSFAAMYALDEARRAHRVLAVCTLLIILAGAAPDVPREVPFQLAALERNSGQMAIVEQTPLIGYWRGAELHRQQTGLLRAWWAERGMSDTISC